jgi:hypothetical protein
MRLWLLAGQFADVRDDLRESTQQRPPPVTSDSDLGVQTPLASQRQQGGSMLAAGLTARDAEPPAGQSNMRARADSIASVSSGSPDIKAPLPLVGSVVERAGLSTSVVTLQPRMGSPMVTVTTKPLQGGNEEGLASVGTSPTKQGLHINGLKRDRRLSENLANGRRKHDDSNVIRGSPEPDDSLETWLAAQQRMIQGVAEAATERVSKNEHLYLHRTAHSTFSGSQGDCQFAATLLLVLQPSPIFTSARVVRVLAAYITQLERRRLPAVAARLRKWSRVPRFKDATLVRSA